MGPLLLVLKIGQCRCPSAAAASALITLHESPIASHQVLLTTEIDEDDPYYDDKCDVLENEVC